MQQCDFSSQLNFLHSEKKKIWKEVRYTSFHLSVETVYTLQARAICTYFCASVLIEGYLPFNHTLSPVASQKLCCLFAWNF